jgi:hypothetical protein
MARRARGIFVAFFALLALSVAAPAHATSINFAKVGLTIFGPAVIAADGIPIFTAPAPATYPMVAGLVNLTGTPQSPTTLPGSFFDVFIEIEVDGVKSPCGSSSSLAPGATFQCQVDQSLTAGAHTLYSYLTFSFANPMLLTGGASLVIVGVTGNGFGTPVTPPGAGGLSTLNKFIIIGGVAGGAAVAPGIVISGTDDVRLAPEPGTLVLVTLGFLLLLRRVPKFMR